jgi:tRNA A-37 threonylcarbamoyl transferase component Bud32
MRRHLIYARSPGWAEFAARAEELIAGGGFEPVKDEARTRAGFVTLEDGGRAFIKRFDSRPWSRGLWDRIRGSRASRSIRGAELLRTAGFRCPEPYAAIDMSRGGSILAAYLISEPLGNAKTVSAFIDRWRRRPDRESRWRRNAIVAVAREVSRLHDRGLFNSDLQETNLMLDDHDGELKIYFVDLDGFRRLRRVGWPRRERNLVQLDRSLGRFLARSARLEFLYAYLGGKPERRKARAIVSRLLARKALEDRKRRMRRAGGPVQRNSRVEFSAPR